MNTNQKWWNVMALALGLPSLIIGVFFGLYALVTRGILSWGGALIVLILVIANSLFLMVRYGLVRKDKQ
jgi:asparagine N-glycosylation enzyme membrane subunit Stt3